MNGHDPRAGQPAQASDLVDIAGLVRAYHEREPDPANPAERVVFGTSGHRGCSLDGSFNQAHILAIAQAVAEYRAQAGIDGPLFLGIDTHALSGPARDTAVEVLVANGVALRLAENDEYTPTPAVSHAILVHNRGRESGLADGIVITPSHNPPRDGGFKYNPPNGGPADTAVTRWIGNRANALLETGLKGVQRMPLALALSADRTARHDFLGAYVADLGSVIDFDAIRGAGLRLGVDPLGGAGVHYWPRIAEVYSIDLDILSQEVDPRFAFMTLDWDGRIRMDPSSPFAMQRLLAFSDRYDVAFACDTDHDRHGVVTPDGLLPSNHYLAVMASHLFATRGWPQECALGKTVVSTSMLDRVAAAAGREVFAVPVGFKWFAGGLCEGRLGFSGEESAGAAFLRRDGQPWTSDKDGIAPALLAAEVTARHGCNPAELYAALEERFGPCFNDRLEAPANAGQRQRLGALEAADLKATHLAGEPVRAVLDRAPGNGEPIGGIRVESASGWFAARPSGTEDIYKIYAESFRDPDHLRRLLKDAQEVVDHTLGA